MEISKKAWKPSKTLDENKQYIIGFVIADNPVQKTYIPMVWTTRKITF